MNKFISTYWDSYRGGIKTIVEVLLFGLIYMGMSNGGKLIQYFSVGLAISFWAFNLYGKLQYRSGNKNYLLIPTKNDTYSKMTSLIFGGALLIGAVLGLCLGSFNAFTIVGSGVGSLIFFNGLYDLPKGKIAVENNKLSVDRYMEDVDVRQLKQIEIFTDRVLITNIYNEIQRADNLNIDDKIALEIMRYLGDSIHDTELNIVNSVPVGAVNYA